MPEQTAKDEAASAMLAALKNVDTWLMEPWTEEEVEGVAVLAEFRKALKTTRAAIRQAEAADIKPREG